jgi:hypothetical protein
MNVAIGCTPQPYYGEPNIYFHYKREFEKRGIGVTYVGLPSENISGYANKTNIATLINSLPQRPDIYLYLEGGSYFPDGLEKVEIPTVALLGDVHLGTWRTQLAHFFDGVVLPLKDYIEPYKSILLHDQVYWLPLSIPPGVEQIAGLERIYDVGFVGNIVFSHRNTPRARRVALVSKHFKTNEMRRNYNVRELNFIYSSSKIVMNVALNGATSYRPLEGAACGALVLTDSTANALGELFEIGKEIVIYRDDADLVESIKYYLKNELERIDIAAAGQKRVLYDHTFEKRIDTLIEIFKTLKICSPIRTANEQTKRNLRRKVFTHLYQLDPILDDARIARRNPLQRVLDIAPALFRRLII